MKKNLLTLIVFGAIVSFATPAFAVGSAGFENSTFSARQIAQGGAGSANPVEPAIISANPAGITELPGIQIQNSAAFINYFTIYHSDSYSDTRSRATIIPIPTAYLTVNPGKVLGDRVSLGVGMDSPFGLSRQYKSQHQISRFAGYDTWFKMYAIKPVVALKVTDKISVGAGPMYYRVMDFGTALTYPTLGAATGSNVRLTTRGQEWGWHGGVLVKATEKHQFGFYFRSPVTMHLSGRLNVEGSVTSGKFETAARTKVDLPLNFTWSYAYKATEKTTLMADFGFTRWSAFERLYVNADSVGNVNDDAVLAAIGRQDKDWNNSYSLQLGANHKLTDKLDFMAGTHFYTKAVPDSSFSPGVPDSHRLGFSFGTKYSATDNLDFSLGYLAQIFLRNRVDNNLGGNEVVGTSSVDGTYYGILQDFVVSMTYKWDGFGHEETPVSQGDGWMEPQGEGTASKSLLSWF